MRHSLAHRGHRQVLGFAVDVGVVKGILFVLPTGPCPPVAAIARACAAGRSRAPSRRDKGWKNATRVDDAKQVRRVAGACSVVSDNKEGRRLLASSGRAVSLAPVAVANFLFDTFAVVQEACARLALEAPRGKAGLVRRRCTSDAPVLARLAVAAAFAWPPVARDPAPARHHGRQFSADAFKVKHPAPVRQAAVPCADTRGDTVPVEEDLGVFAPGARTRLVVRGTVRARVAVVFALAGQARAC